MHRRLFSIGAGLALGLSAQVAPAAVQVNVVCSMNPEWCRNAAAIYSRLHDVQVNVINKPTGESYAQLQAERERSKVDLWFGSTADPHLQAAENGLTEVYRSPKLPQLHPWAQAVAKGESALSVSFLHNAAQEAEAGYPVRHVAPCEGIGYSVGAMSLVKGGPNPEQGRRFYEWALSVPGQKVAATSRSYQFPSNKATPVPPGAPSLAGVTLISYDIARYGASAERRRLLARWEQEIGSKAVR